MFGINVNITTRILFVWNLSSVHGQCHRYTVNVPMKSKDIVESKRSVRTYFVRHDDLKMTHVWWMQLRNLSWDVRKNADLKLFTRHLSKILTSISYTKKQFRRCTHNIFLPFLQYKILFVIFSILRYFSS